MAPFDLHSRASGLLLHPTSLPSPHGIGDLGPSAHAFADFLADSGQGWWQMLPIGPTDAWGSPYGSSSAFAGNPLLLSLERLAGEGLLPPEQVGAAARPSTGRVDFARAWEVKEPLLRAAFRAFERLDGERRAGFEAFRRENAGWLGDFTLFTALKQRFGGALWADWPPEIRRREPGALERAREALGGEIRFLSFLQHEFFRQWEALRGHCRRKGVGLIGDIPIYVSRESADVWANPALFRLDPEGRPEAVAGVPPDYFNSNGQLWGNPLYRWDTLRERGYGWWIARLSAAFRFFDASRLDHFIGFTRYWEVPGGAPTAREGRWREGPGYDFFAQVQRAFGRLDFIAEDLGDVTPEVFELRDRLGLPGMRVLQFAFGGGNDNLHLPPHHPERCVVYTGTHDNDTTMGWFARLMREGPPHERERALRWLNHSENEIHWEMIRLAFLSRAHLAVIPVQDLLGLGTEARMNYPGEMNGNWAWRLREGELTETTRARLREETRAAGRLRG
ncbi:MAG: 4-alpha-glucanotransferase [Candidatus Tectomicrobia bacterium]|uniref:4-alpha-glucanotransferase n=1 Tax=Tectimicrobiota bacterium TaxID=2528274 RepID=A0A932MQY6_UNCTE|nr:4-alpha-glucanotransferase [Candidatus Tectomicrobia bacterium]